LAKERASQLEGTFAEPSKLRLAAYLDRWLEDGARPAVRPPTYVSYKGIIHNHIAPRIGGVMLSKLTPIHVQSMYSDMERGGASARIRQLTHAVLRRSLKQAIRWGLLHRNVCDAVEPPRVQRKEVTFLTVEQSKKLLTASESERLHAVFVLAITTGMRMGEIFALQWRNVDLKRKSISVCHTMMELKGKLTLTEPKTVKSRRRVDLPQMAVEALLDHKARMLTEGFGEVPWVFCNTLGGPLRRTHFSHDVFLPLLKRTKLPRIRFHDLRHTSASLLLAAGVHPKVVQERLGHSQIAITMDTYSHVMPTLGAEAAGKMDAVLAG
jgi:integrase